MIGEKSCNLVTCRCHSLRVTSCSGARYIGGGFRFFYDWIFFSSPREASSLVRVVISITCEPPPPRSPSNTFIPKHHTIFWDPTNQLISIIRLISIVSESCNFFLSRTHLARRDTIKHVHTNIIQLLGPPKPAHFIP